MMILLVSVGYIKIINMNVVSNNIDTQIEIEFDQWNIGTYDLLAESLFSLSVSSFLLVA